MAALYFQLLLTYKLAETKLKPYLRGLLAPDILVIDASKLEALQQELQALGFEIADDVLLERE